MAHLLISAARKSSGKTVLSIGISAALRSKGLKVQTFKKGPDYIDPMWLAKATRLNCYNLDFWTQSEQEITSTFATQSLDSNIGIIEGNKGLHDGLATDGSDSNAALAKLLGAPVILILDARGTIRGVAPLLLGYQQFDPAVNIAGVILNFVGGHRHATKLTAALERYTSIPVLGTIQRATELELAERYLGLMPSNEDQFAREKITRIASLVAQQVDLEQIITIANTAPDVQAPAKYKIKRKDYGLKVAYAKDEAFGFYYADDLETFAQYGVKLLPFDTLKDTRLPDADALFIGGGFPEKRLRQLAANTRIKQAIYDAVEHAMPGYAECGGLMYLCNSIRFQSEQCEMVGVIEGECEILNRPVGRGYVLLQRNSLHPWPNVENRPIAGHEFHYSRLTAMAGHTNYVFDVKRGFGIDGQKDGVVYRNLVACYAHQRNTRQNQWIVNFLDFVKSCKLAHI